MSSPVQTRNSTTPSGPATARLASLDALRGCTVAAMLLVNDPGDWGHVYAPLEHSAWNGCTPTDLVFPFFLFVVGVSVALAILPRLEQGAAPSALTRAAMWRALRILAGLRSEGDELLALMGWLVNQLQLALRLANRLVDIGLASSDPKVKLACLETAIILGDQQAFELLKDIIAQNNSDLTLQAIQKIARMTSSDTLSGFAVEMMASGYYDLINRWKRTQESSALTLAGQITHSLEGIKNPRSLPIIRGLLDSSEPDLVLSAVRILANIGEKEDIFTLRTLLIRVTTAGSPAGADESLRAEINTAIETLRTTLDFRDE